MNDLTKKEFEDVELVYRSFCGDGRALTDLEQSIMKKLKAIVENYCEHEKATTIHPGDTVLICNQCETILSPWNLRKYQP